MVWIGSLILLSGDIHPNPGPDGGNHSVHTSSSTDLYNFLNLPNHLSTVHCNVQSLANKVDVLISELSYFDLVSFSETWLGKSVSSQDLLFPTFHPPECKDRLSDRYGGVILGYINIYMEIWFGAKSTRVYLDPDQIAQQKKCSVWCLL